MGTVRAPARGSRGAVVRTYAAPDRESAERSYDDDRLAAGERGWVPVSRFWRSEGRDQVLTVVFELTLADSVLTSQVEVEDAAARRKVEGTGPHWTVAASGSLLSRSVPPVDAGAPVPWDEERARQRDASRRQVTTLDLHCAGEPLRLIRTGFPEVPQPPIAERRLWAIEHADDVRRTIMHEPRGHRDMYGAVLLPPDRRRRRHRGAVHAQRGLQHDVRPRHHRAHARPHRGRPLSRRPSPRRRSAGRRRPGW